uniref:Coiled-coil domain containing 32 n=1 Tax=Petromyzon marinus TaxID=7757 RepID=S4RL69_PETMA
MQWGTQTLILATSLCNATSSSVNTRQDGRAAPDSASGRLDDSAAYLALLESRLRRIKGQERAVSSREMVSSLAQARQECLDRLLHDDSSTEAFTEDNLEDGKSSLTQFRRWLAPERVAVTAEELEQLIPPVAMVENSTASTNGGTADTRAAAVS